MKLRCLFEFTEAEQQRLALQQPIPNEPAANTASTATTIPNSQQNSKSIDQETKQAVSQASKSIVTNLSQLEKPPVANIQANPASTVTASIAKSSDSDALTKDFDSNNSIKNSFYKQSTDRNDNLLNEIKLVKQENENLKKEVARLKVCICIIF